MSRPGRAAGRNFFFCLYRPRFQHGMRMDAVVNPPTTPKLFHTPVYDTHKKKKRKKRWNKVSTKETIAGGIKKVPEVDTLVISGLS